MDCMASNAAAKNGLVLSSPPAARGILVLSLRATTECEFDLARISRSQNRLEPDIYLKMRRLTEHKEEALVRHSQIC